PAVTVYELDGVVHVLTRAFGEACHDGAPGRRGDPGYGLGEGAVRRLGRPRDGVPDVVPGQGHLRADQQMGPGRGRRAGPLGESGERRGRVATVSRALVQSNTQGGLGHPCHLSHLRLVRALTTLGIRTRGKTAFVRWIRASHGCFRRMCCVLRGITTKARERAGQPPPTATVGSPESMSSPISSAIRMASSMRVSTICDSGTVLMTSPLTKI